jgi:HD superfamily phosphodiesterase
MDLTGSIESAEKQYKQILEEFFVSVFHEKTLTSHGIDHHRRVWQYSKELLKEIQLQESLQSSDLPGDLIIACYLHDIGMSVNPGVKHGIYSRKLCELFISRYKLSQNDLTEVLYAIENHDNKDYSGTGPMNDLLTILSVSDDLDALGYTGIFRYSEIYLTRGILPEKIGIMVRDNVKKRFDNVVNILGEESEYIDRHRKRFNILYDFFGKYNEELTSYHFGTGNPYGHCGVMEIIQYMMKSKLLLKDIFREPENYTGDPWILSFLGEMENESSLLLKEH